MSKKKVLIVTYYWPPAGGPGVQRWLKFVKYLPDFNIEPIVYTPDNPNYPIVDNSLLHEVSENITILKRPIREPYKLAAMISKKTSTAMRKGFIPDPKNQNLIERIMLFIRGNFFIPDARIGWVAPSVQYLSGYIQKNNIGTLITTGPPHSLHLIGLELKKTLGLRWIADFRDPWTSIGYQKHLKLTKRSKRKHKALEREVLQTADQIIVTSNITKLDFENLTNVPVEVITNGYDYEPMPNITLDEKFSLSHIGSLLSERNPIILWQVLRELIDENDVFASSFQLNLVGAVSEAVVRSIHQYGLEHYMNSTGYIPHADSLRYQRQSQLLLLIEIDSKETTCIVPGKLFEYMVSNRPIVALGPKGSEVERIIKDTNTGKYLLYSDRDRLKEVLLHYFTAYKKGELESHGIGLQKYARKSLTGVLSKLI